MSKFTAFRHVAVEPADATPPAERIVAGKLSNRSWRNYVALDQNLVSGLWEATPGTWRMDYKVWEFCHVLSGRCVITPEGQAPIELKAGDAFVCEPGLKGTWQVLETMRKHYVIRKDVTEAMFAAKPAKAA